MKIVIDLDEKYYNDIKNSATASNYSTLYALFGIRNGTPLPKGHGRLINADEFQQTLENIPIKDNDKWFNWLQKACIRLGEAPTIIEADKENK